MTSKQFAAVVAAREELVQLVQILTQRAPYLPELQKKMLASLGENDYPLETAIVYNRELDEITQSSQLEFIIVADNPGKQEQLAQNNRYLIGQAGKIAAGFFEKKFAINLHSNCLILNKTPIHTPKTSDLHRLLKSGDDKDLHKFALLLDESQVAMAQIAYKLHSTTGIPLWICGYGELGERGIFAQYAQKLRALVSVTQSQQKAKLEPQIYLYPHFSMNRCGVELKQKTGDLFTSAENGGASRSQFKQAVLDIGRENCRRILEF